MIRSTNRLQILCGGIAALCLLALGGPQAARAQSRPIIPRDDVGLDQKLNAQAPLDLPFRDETGKTVPLRTFFGKRPVLLQMPFYRCPGICTLELDGLTRGAHRLTFDPGKDYDIVIVSINPKEDAPLAAAKKQEYMKLYGRPGTESGWHFLTGEENSIRQLAKAVGYRYVYDVKTDQYAHPAGLMVLTPEGRVSRYFYGVSYPPKDLRFALVEASANKIGTPVDQLLLMCYHYDPQTGRYGLVVMNVLRLAGFATVLMLSTSIFIMYRWERARTQQMEEMKEDNTTRRAPSQGA